MVQVTLPEVRESVHLVYPSRPTPREFYDFCQANPDVWCELTEEGEIVVMPPAGTESGFRSGEIFFQLALWARQAGGRVTDASAGFALPDGSVRAPDAAWIDERRIQALGPARKDPYLPLAPDFIVEVMSASDRLPDAQAKMRMWIRNGVQLGWLIDPFERRVFIYRNWIPETAQVEILFQPESVRADGPVDGFVLELRRIWEGL